MGLTVGNGAIEVADILVGGTAKTFTPSTPGTFTTVVITDLITPTVVASGWAGLAMRKDVTSSGAYNYWRCDLSLGYTPKLTIEYLAP